MLEDERGRAVRKVLQNVGPVVHVREVCLAGVLAGLQHLPFGQGRNNAVARSPPVEAPAAQRTLRQGVERGGLVRIFAVTQAFFLIVEGPGAFVVDEFFVPQQYGQGIGESVLVDGAVHGFEVRHECLRA